jgi:hypothetical protein
MNHQNMSTSEDCVDLPDVVVEEVSPENVLDDALVFLPVILEEFFAVGVPVIPPFLPGVEGDVVLPVVGDDALPFLSPLQPLEEGANWENKMYHEFKHDAGMSDENLCHIIAFEALFREWYKSINYNSNLQWPFQIKWMRGTCYKWDLPKHISERLSIGWSLFVIQKKLL